MSLDEFFALIHHAAKCSQCRTFLYSTADSDTSVSLCTTGRGLTPSTYHPLPVTAEHAHFKAECEEIGLVYQGVQSGVPEIGLEALVLFAEHELGTTRSLPVSEFTKEMALSRFHA